jgi:diaminopropionate ammonia-lyase
MAADVGVAAIHVKDEGQRLGLGSFKALGGAFAVVKLVLEEAGTRLGRVVDYRDLYSPEVRDVAATITVACATDGNHGRSVSQGAQLIGAKAAIFVHSGVSELRKAAIAAFGAQVINVEGNYDDSVAHAAAVAEKQGWLIVSDTSWPGYERVPGLVMQGYTVMVREALRQLPAPPTHVFLQAGVGGFAAAVAGHLSIAVPEERVVVVVVDPARAACLFESAKVGRPVRIPQGEPTVMAMLECYEPSLVAWRILSRLADAFMTVDEGDAVAAMNLLAKPKGTDVPIVAGESGGAGLAGLLSALADEVSRATLGLNAASRILLINTEGATDPSLYESLVGIPPGAVGAGREPDAA